MATCSKYPSLERQWRKMMYFFYPYQSTKNRNATPEEWRIRRMIWDFKDGRSFENIAYMVVNKLSGLYGTNIKDIVFACVPASSAEKNEKRYKEFSNMVCSLSGAINAYSHIRIENEKLAIHEGKENKKLSLVQVIDFDNDFFKGKKVLVFDDVCTKGFAYARFANQIEKLGAEVLGGMFIGRTVYQG